MADFFSRLAERTLGLAAVARPAIAPMFAPASQIVTEPAEAFMARPKPVANREESEQPSGPPSAREETHDPTPAVSKPSAVITEEATAATVGAEPRLSVARHEMPMERRAIEVDRIEPAIRSLEVRASTNLPSLKRGVPPLVEEASGSTELGRKVEPTEPDVARTAHTPVTLPETVLRKEMSRASGRRTNIAEERAQAEAAVRVNIGRIEVRAVFPETPAPLTASPAVSSSLSLAEYLKQRDGGTR